MPNWGPRCTKAFIVAGALTQILCWANIISWNFLTIWSATGVVEKTLLWLMTDRQSERICEWWDFGEQILIDFAKKLKQKVIGLFEWFRKRFDRSSGDGDEDSIPLLPTHINHI